MKERPILFSSPMVQALLDGRKNQTRRIVKPQPNIDPQTGDILMYKGSEFEKVLPASEYGKQTKCPYGKIGDRLWVRETWREADSLLGGSTLTPPVAFAYKADKTIFDYKGAQYNTFGLNFEKFKWKPSIFMPRAACRIMLEITDVRVQRLHDISEQDAILEGIEKWPDGNYKAYGNNAGKFRQATDSFRSLWASINGFESWNANPLVWALTFKRI